MNSPQQATLFQELPRNFKMPNPVNVASVPQRSPFRYPGGKTWFVPIFRKWMATLESKPRTLVEPFSGGGIISLTALFENLVQKTVMAELDEEIAAVWESIVNGDGEWLANRILTFELTMTSVLKEIQKTPKTKRQKAFQTILKNRTYHGGILAEGSGLLKYGENGKGIHSRWYPNTIAKRLRNINLIATKIKFLCDDGLKVLKKFTSTKNAVFFIDPPYTAGRKKAGRRLYKHCDLDHEKLFQICERLKGDFLMTYENAEEVKEMAHHHGFHMRLVPMTNTHHAKMQELVISRDLSWMNGFPEINSLNGNGVLEEINGIRRNTN